MCGIAGMVGRNASERRDIVSRMTAALARRGPDAEGVEAWPDAVLGHRRLSIFDLSPAGSQPMLSEDRQIAVVFNGAIYNFHELRKELEAKGYRFRSNTDTEVLIHGYRAWGIDRLIERSRGMFAIGLWDEERGKLFLVRDRLGVKPLLYSIHQGQIAFGSTLEALRHFPGTGELNEEAVNAFLEFGYVPDDWSIYRGVSKLPMGSILEWSNGRADIRRYWKPPLPEPEPARISYEEAVERTENLLLEAVKLRLQADVPVGALLSGGIDSGLVCWAIQKLGGDITAYIVGTPGDQWDETADGVKTAQELGIRHQVIPMHPEDSPSIEMLVEAYGEPFACHSALGMLRVSKAVRETATVLLTGDGGDDVMLGYPAHKNLLLAESVARWLPPGASTVWRGVRGVLPNQTTIRRAKQLVDYAAGGIGPVHRVHDGLPYYRAQNLLGDRLQGLEVPRRLVPWSAQSGRRVLSDWLEENYRNQFVGEYMTKVDGATMYYALEARSPFLDQELWNFAGRLPYRLRMQGGRMKAILRTIAERRVSPRLAYGPKRGFRIPVQRWMADRWNGLAREAFSGSLLEQERVIRGEAVRREIEKAAGSGEAPLQLWYLLVLEYWLRRQRSGHVLTEPVARQPVASR